MESDVIVISDNINPINSFFLNKYDYKLPIKETAKMMCVTEKISVKSVYYYTNENKVYCEAFNKDGKLIGTVDNDLNMKHIARF